MSKPLKFRYVNTIVGTFVLLMLSVVIVGIALAGRAQQWLTEKRLYMVRLPTEGSYGLQEGAEIQILGTVVGWVEDIRVDEDANMRAEVIVKGDFIHLVRDDSRASIKKKMVLFGDTYIEITKDSEGPEIVDGEWLGGVARRDTELLEQADAMIEDIRAKVVSQAQELLNKVEQQVENHVVPAIDAIRDLAVEHRKLAADIRDPESPLMRDVSVLTANLAKMSEELKRGAEQLNKVLENPETAENINESFASLRESIVRLQSILRHVDATLAEFPAMAANLRGEFEDVPGFVYQTTRTLQEAERLLRTLQEHWLIGGSPPARAESRRIAPVEVIGAGGEE